MNKKLLNKKLKLGILFAINFGYLKINGMGNNFTQNYQQTFIRNLTTTFNYVKTKPYISSSLFFSPYIFLAARYFSSDNSNKPSTIEGNMMEGKYVWIDKDGLTHFNYPNIDSKPNTIKKFPTASGPMKFDPDRDLYYQDIDQTDDNSEQNNDNDTIKLCAKTVVKNLSAMDVFIEDINKATGLSIEEIKKILEK